MGVSKVDLSGIELTEFSFTGNGGIDNLTESTFFSPFLITKLDKCDSSDVNCHSVEFSSSNWFIGPTQLLDCDFFLANLTKASFADAILAWRKKPPHERPPPFYKTNLSGTSFACAEFHNADFTDAENILKADLQVRQA